MRILLSNDDGIHAPGLVVLEGIAAKLSDDVWVVAPESEQSGAAHSLTLHSPLRVKKFNEKRYAVNGTPTDAVMLAVKEIMPQKPDLVLSGVNSGANLGDDVTYSGTVAAAMEGTLLGIRSIALSQMCVERDAISWLVAEEYAPELIKKLLKVDWAPDTLMNINFPEIEPSKVKGVRMVAQGKRKIGDTPVQNRDPEGRPYYWLGTRRKEEKYQKGTDLEAVYQGYIPVTPLCINLTNHHLMQELTEGFTVEFSNRA